MAGQIEKDKQWHYAIWPLYRSKYFLFDLHSAADYLTAAILGPLTLAASKETRANKGKVIWHIRQIRPLSVRLLLKGGE